MAKKREEECKGGLPAWMGTYGDMVTLLLCFFVLLFSMSSVDVRKFKEAIASFNDQIDIMPGGVAITDGDRINNGVSQLNDIEIIVQNSLPTSADGKNLDGIEDLDDTEVTDEEIMQAALEKAEEVKDMVSEYLSAQGVRDDVELNYSLNYVKITIPGETLFDSGQALIKDEAYDIINVLGDMIQEQTFDTYNVQIEGHTDDRPINTLYFPSNWELSAARAIAVGKYLIDEKGFSEDKIACTGYGEYRPLVDNDSAENRAKNRRVEIKIVLQSAEVTIDEYGESSVMDPTVDERSTDTTNTTDTTK